MPLERGLLLVVAAGALGLGACSGQPRMGDVQSTSMYVAAPDRSERSGRGGGRDEPKMDEQTRRNNADVLVELGQRYYARGEYEIALEKLQSALSIDPTSANGHTVIAILYETINDSERAAEHYRKSVQYGGRNGGILNNYGSWLCRQQRFDDADEHFRKALADPFYRSPESALANAGTCALAAGKFDVAENYLRQVLAARPEDEQALIGMAEVAWRKNDFLNARAFLQRAESRTPLSRTALQLGAQIEESLGDASAAAAYRARMASQDDS
jgi:type IV pilus assembly protein PilF